LTQESDVCLSSDAQEIVLKDASRIDIWRLNDAAEDQGKIQQWLRRSIIEGYGMLSMHSRRLRFGSPPHRLAPWQLSHLSNPDMAQGAIWLATQRRGNKLHGVGLARCMRLDKQPDAVEIALTVLDRYQNKGVGRAFLAIMAQHAKQANLRRLVAYVLWENKPMLHLLAEAGASPPHDEAGLLRVDVPLVAGRLSGGR
jgi:RimJ/RimL family protein N-acetyltransferase